MMKQDNIIRSGPAEAHDTWAQGRTPKKLRRRTAFSCIGIVVVLTSVSWEVKIELNGLQGAHAYTSHPTTTKFRKTSTRKRIGGFSLSAENDNESSVLTSTISKAKVSSKTQGKNKTTQNKLFDASRDIENRIMRFGRQGRIDEALEVYYSLWSSSNFYDIDDTSSNLLHSTNLKIHPKTRHMNAALDACARARPVRLAQAFDLWHNGLQRGLSPNVYTFGSLMHACARSNSPDVIPKTLEMLSSMPCRYGVTPNHVIWSTALLACRHQPYTALGLLRLAQEHKSISFNVVAYNTILSSLASKKDDSDALAAAEALVKEMEYGHKMLHVKLPASVANNVSNSSTSSSNRSAGEHSSFAYSALHCLDRSSVSLLTGHVTEAEDATRDPRIPIPDRISYATLMSAYESQSKWRSILQIARQMEKQHEQDQKAQEPNGDKAKIMLDGLALSTVLNACQNLGLADDALYYLRLMKEFDTENQSEESNDLLDRRVTRGRERQGAKQDLTGPDVVAYSLAIGACTRAGRWRDGLALLEDMKNSLKNGWQNDDNVAVPYTVAIDGCAEKGQWKMAVKLLHDMICLDKVKPTVFTYSAVIHACAVAAGQPDLQDLRQRSVPMWAALKILDQMNNSQNSICEPVDKTDDKNLELGDDEINKMIKNLAPPNPIQPNIVTYNSAIQACAEGMSLAHAFKLLERIREEQNDDINLKPTLKTFGSLMTACERVGNVAAVKKVFSFMAEQHPDLRPNEIIYGAALSCCRKARQPTTAYSLFQKMLKEQIKPNVATCNTVIATLIEHVSSHGSSSSDDRAKSLERAALIFKAMEASPRYTSEKPNNLSYSLLIRGNAEMSKAEEAERLLRRLKERQESHQPLRVELYTAVVTAYERSKRPLKALKLMEEMRAEGYDFYNVKVLNSAFKRLLKITNQLALGGTD